MSDDDVDKLEREFEAEVLQVQATWHSREVRARRKAALGELIDAIAAASTYIDKAAALDAAIDAATSFGVELGRELGVLSKLKAQRVALRP